MKKLRLSIFILFIITFCSVLYFHFKPSYEFESINGTVISFNDNKIIVQDNQNVIYTFNFFDSDIEIGSNILIKYEDEEIIDFELISNSIDYLDSGIFSDYYDESYDKLNSLSIDEKIGQLFLVRYNKENDIENLNKYHFGGYVFFKNDFKGKTTEEVQNMINNLQSNSNIPLLTAVDEEGGEVVRISSNHNLVDSEFKSSKELYKLGSFDLIRQDTINKSKILSNLGINLNLAPVVDVSTNPNDYMYERAIGENVDITKEYSKTVIEASKGTNVSYTLKHFPGYGNNVDTHLGTAIDNRSYESILNNDIPPFEEGIKSGAEAVLVSHNIVSSIDSDNPASLSYKVHNLLRKELNFTGIIITDDLFMGATNNIDNAAVQAILSGNDLIIATDYEDAINSVKEAINNGVISEQLINKLALRVIAWKYYKGLL